ncbi:hypothetical protein DY218_12100 [Streptomyces triticagri]|uniref:Secreted protein n=1 Tax=Streptomyces triticagri TaxID=2293568 RepID=A0A372M676_9ACTN|nr:DUF6344 domain-containing protein [Streptomyces triticagri]RFU86444.1 hypothetical protein DY218_12100 [Streptomyces triticagri]
MAGNTFTRIWAAAVTAILALFAALGFTTTATAAPSTTAPQQEDAGRATAPVTRSVAPAAHSPRPYDAQRPPTMKQRIRAEAHGSSPNARGLGGLVTPLTRTGEVSEESETEEARERSRPGNSEELPGLGLAA